MVGVLLVLTIPTMIVCSNISHYFHQLTIVMIHQLHFPPLIINVAICIHDFIQPQGTIAAFPLLIRVFIAGRSPMILVVFVLLQQLLDGENVSAIW